MILVQPEAGRSTADSVAPSAFSNPLRCTQRRWQVTLAEVVGVLALLGVASSAAALTISGGPRYALTQDPGSPVTGTCTVRQRQSITFTFQVQSW